MRIKVLLAAFLLGVGLCFVPVLGRGELRVPHGGEITADLELYKEEPLYPVISRMNEEIERSKMDIELLRSTIGYTMKNSTVPAYVECYYDADGHIGGGSEVLPDDG